MKFDITAGTLEQHGILESHRFSVANTPHMMKLLSGQYSNIEQAVVREIGTNVYDAYQMLPEGATIHPPVIHVPTAEEPWLEFKDFGVGMAKDDVLTRYTQYGDSTKRNDNTQVGGLGIGCKVPFCYPGCDQLLVESRFGGERLTFIAVVGADGCPTMNLVGRQPTTEHTGMTVRIPIRPQDIRRFEAELHGFMQFFPMPVRFTGQVGFTVRPIDYHVRHGSWGLVRGAGSSKLIMGNVAYPIADSEMVRDTPLSYTHIAAFSLHLFADVGDADFAPSREALMYTDKTRACIKLHVDRFFTELATFASEQIKDCATEWAALSYIYDNWSLGGLRQSLQGIEWQGRPLDLVSGIKYDLSALAAQHPGIEAHVWEREGGKFVGSRSSSGRFLPGETFWVAIDDTTKFRDGERRIKHHLERHLFAGTGRRRRSSYDQGRMVVFNVSEFAARLQAKFGGAKNITALHNCSCGWTSNSGEAAEVHFRECEDGEEVVVERAPLMQQFGSAAFFDALVDGGKAPGETLSTDGTDGGTATMTAVAAVTAPAAPITVEPITAEALSALLGGIPVLMVSDLRLPPPPERSQSGPRAKTQIKRYSGDREKPWADATVDPGTICYYVRIRGDEVIDPPPGAPTNPQTIASMFTVARTVGVIPADAQFVAIPRSCQKLEKTPGWVDLLPTLQTLRVKLPRSLTKASRAFFAWQPLVDDDMVLLLQQLDLTTLPARSLVARVARTVREAFALFPTVAPWKQYADTFDILLPGEAERDAFDEWRREHRYSWQRPAESTPCPPDPSADARALLASVRETYPMLALWLDQKQYVRTLHATEIATITQYLCTAK